MADDLPDVVCRPANEASCDHLEAVFGKREDAATCQCHLGQPALDAAVEGAAKRQLGDAWALSRRNSSTSISPLVASVLALWSVTAGAPEFDVMASIH